MKKRLKVSGSLRIEFEDGKPGKIFIGDVNLSGFLANEWSIEPEERSPKEGVPAIVIFEAIK